MRKFIDKQMKLIDEEEYYLIGRTPEGEDLWWRKPYKYYDWFIHNEFYTIDEYRKECQSKFAWLFEDFIREDLTLHLSSFFEYNTLTVWEAQRFEELMDYLTSFNEVSRITCKGGEWEDTVVSNRIEKNVLPQIIADMIKVISPE